MAHRNAYFTHKNQRFFTVEKSRSDTGYKHCLNHASNDYESAHAQKFLMVIIRDSECMKR
jgi:hypothetical protein